MCTGLPCREASFLKSNRPPRHFQIIPLKTLVLLIICSSSILGRNNFLYKIKKYISKKIYESNEMIEVI